MLFFDPTMAISGCTSTFLPLTKYQVPYLHDPTSTMNRATATISTDDPTFFVIIDPSLLMFYVVNQMRLPHPCTWSSSKTYSIFID